MKALELSEAFRAAFDADPTFAIGIVTAATTDLISRTAHTLGAGDRVRFTTTTTLPAGLSLLTDYYVLASGLTANDFKVSTTNGGSAVDITDTGTGTHTVSRCFACLNDLGDTPITLPCLIFRVDDKPLNSDGTALTFTLSVWAETSADGTTPRESHAALVALARTKLHGTGKAALLAALNAAEEFDWRGWNAADDAPGLQAHHYRTSICATGAVLVL